MVLQTCRHVVDFSFNEANHDAAARNTSPNRRPSPTSSTASADGLACAA
ncbi:hypothetical protein SVIOM342S_09094 [Streptomyces violaceorubidus]